MKKSSILILCLILVFLPAGGLVSGSAWGDGSDNWMDMCSVETCVTPDENSTIAPVSFGNNPPNVPSSPSPTNHVTDVSIDADLSWVGGDPDPEDTVIYDVYFGTSPDPPLVSSYQSTTTYDLGVLNDDTTEGTTWEFTAEDGGIPVGSAFHGTLTVNGIPAELDTQIRATVDATGTTATVVVDTVGQYPWLMLIGTDADVDKAVTFEILPPGFTAWLPVATDPADSIFMRYGHQTINLITQTETTYNPGILNYNTKYYWKIVATDSYGVSIEGPIWDFTTQDAPNNPPNVPSDPSPTNHDIGVSINTDLSWIGGDTDIGDTVTYDVYFGTSPDPPLVSSYQSTAIYDLGTLNDENTDGPIWDFTAQDGGIPVGSAFQGTVTVNGNPGEPGMQIRATVADTGTTATVVVDTAGQYPWLMLIGTDADIDKEVTFEVLPSGFTTWLVITTDPANPTFIRYGHQNVNLFTQMGATYDPGTLNYDTEYYWKIVATDSYGAYTEGPIWDFTTQDGGIPVSSAFQGTVTVNGNPGEPGTQVRATVAGTGTMETVTMDTSGQYPWLMLIGSDADVDKMVTFEVLLVGTTTWLAVTTEPSNPTFISYGHQTVNLFT